MTRSTLISSHSSVKVPKWMLLVVITVIFFNSLFLNVHTSTEEQDLPKNTTSETNTTSTNITGSSNQTTKDPKTNITTSEETGKVTGKLNTQLYEVFKSFAQSKNTTVTTSKDDTSATIKLAMDFMNEMENANRKYEDLTFSNTYKNKKELAKWMEQFAEFQDMTFPSNEDLKKFVKEFQELLYLAMLHNYQAEHKLKSLVDWTTEEKSKIPPLTKLAATIINSEPDQKLNASWYKPYYNTSKDFLKDFDIPEKDLRKLIKSVLVDIQVIDQKLKETLSKNASNKTNTTTTTTSTSTTTSGEESEKTPAASSSKEEREPEKDLSKKKVKKVKGAKEDDQTETEKEKDSQESEKDPKEKEKSTETEEPAKEKSKESETDSSSGTQTNKTLSDGSNSSSSSSSSSPSTKESGNKESKELVGVTIVKKLKGDWNREKLKELTNKMELEINKAVTAVKEKKVLFQDEEESDKSKGKSSKKED